MAGGGKVFVCESVALAEALDIAAAATGATTWPRGPEVS